MGEDNVGPQSKRYVTVDEAARHLGLTVDAIRKRVQRGQIPHEKDAAGRVRIILDESETVQDEGQTRQDRHREDRTNLLIAELQNRIQALEEANRENRRLLAAALERIPPQLEAPSEPRESPVSRGPGDAPTDTRQDSEGREEPRERPQERSSLWQRLFGG